MYRIDLVYSEYGIDKKGYQIKGVHNNRIGNEKDVEVRFERSKSMMGVFVENTADIMFVKGAKKFVDEVFELYQFQLNEECFFKLSLTIFDSSTSELVPIEIFEGIIEWSSFDFEPYKTYCGFIENSPSKQLFDKKGIEYSHSLPANKRLYNIDPTKILQADLSVVWSKYSEEPRRLFDLKNWDSNDFQTLNLKLDDKEKYENRPLEKFYSDSFKIKTAGQTADRDVEFFFPISPVTLDFRLAPVLEVGMYQRSLTLTLVADIEKESTQVPIFEKTQVLKPISYDSASFVINKNSFKIPTQKTFQLKWQLKPSKYDTQIGDVYYTYYNHSLFPGGETGSGSLVSAYYLTGNCIFKAENIGALNPYGNFHSLIQAQKRDTFNLKGRFSIQSIYELNGNSRSRYTRKEVVSKISIIVYSSNKKIKMKRTLKTHSAICDESFSNYLNKGFYQSMTNSCPNKIQDIGYSPKRNDNQYAFDVDESFDVEVGDHIAIEVYQSLNFGLINKGSAPDTATFKVYSYVSMGEDAVIDIFDSQGVSQLYSNNFSNTITQINHLNIDRDFDINAKYQTTNLDVFTSTNEELIKSFSKRFPIKISRQLSTNKIFNHTELTNVKGMSVFSTSKNEFNLSFEDYFRDMSKLFALGVRFNGEYVELCELSEIYNLKKNVIDLGRVFGMEKTVNDIFKIKNIKTGSTSSIDWEYGDFEYNENQDYSTMLQESGIKDLSISKLRNDVSFFNRTQMQRILGTLKSGSKKESKDIFLLATDFLGNATQEHPIKPFFQFNKDKWNERAGVPVNVCLSPRYQIERWKNYIGSVLTDSNAIYRTSNNGNTDDSTARSTFNLQNLPVDKYFGPLKFKLKIKANPYLLEQIRKNKDARCRFVFDNKEYFGWIESVSINPFNTTIQDIVLVEFKL